MWFNVSCICVFHRKIDLFQTVIFMFTSVVGETSVKFTIEYNMSFILLLRLFNISTPAPSSN